MCMSWAHDTRASPVDAGLSPQITAKSRKEGFKGEEKRHSSLPWDSIDVPRNVQKLSRTNKKSDAV